jgi:hypothetical protein
VTTILFRTIVVEMLAMPVDELMVIAVWLLSHVPPGSLSVNVTVVPEHTVAGAVIGAGAANTLTVTDSPPTRPIVAEPAATPVTTPEEFTVAFVDPKLVHAPVPPPDSVVVLFSQTVVVPLMIA